MDHRLDPKSIGDVGESAVRTWAHQVGITPNKVENDEHGWDYVLELPRGHLKQGGISLDLIPCEVRCYAQVKTIVAEENRVRISLSNWDRMAKDPSPWFVVVVVLNTDLRPVAAFLAHVDESWVGRVLKRLRELPESSRLNEHVLELTWEESQRFAELHGRSLSDGIRFHVGEDLNAYAARKRSWIENVGYERERHHLQMSLAATSEDEALRMAAEFAVGLREELPLAAFKVEEIRFDLAKEVATFNGEGGTVELVDRKPDGTTRITLEQADHGDAMTLSCATYRASAVVPGLPEKYRWVRFVAPFCSWRSLRPRSESCASST